MRKLFIMLLMVLGTITSNAQSSEDKIGDVRDNNGLYYVVYDVDGNRMGTISNAESVLVGFSESIIILEKNNLYYFYDTSLNRYDIKPTHVFGKIVSVNSNGFVAEKNGRRVFYDRNGNRK